MTNVGCLIGASTAVGEASATRAEIFGSPRKLRGSCANLSSSHPVVSPRPMRGTGAPQPAQMCGGVVQPHTKISSPGQRQRRLSDSRSDSWAKSHVTLLALSPSASVHNSATQQHQDPNEFARASTGITGEISETGSRVKCNKSTTLKTWHAASVDMARDTDASSRHGLGQWEASLHKNTPRSHRPCWRQLVKDLQQKSLEPEASKTLETFKHEAVQQEQALVDNLQSKRLAEEAALQHNAAVLQRKLSRKQQDAITSEKHLVQQKRYTEAAAAKEEVVRLAREDRTQRSAEHEQHAARSRAALEQREKLAMSKLQNQLLEQLWACAYQGKIPLDRLVANCPE